MQAMYYERKFTDVEPHGEIAVQYRKGTDLDAKNLYWEEGMDLRSRQGTENWHWWAL